MAQYVVAQSNPLQVFFDLSRWFPTTGGLKMIYIAFLRAINVGGRFVKMERLRQIFEDLGFENVRSVIQSGNIAFDAPGDADRAKITRAIEDRLASELGYTVDTMVRSIAEVEAIVEADPFAGVTVTPATRLCVVFVSKPLPKSVQLPLPIRVPQGEMEIVAATQGEIFVVVRQIEGRAVNPTAYLEKTYSMKTTTRFYSAVNKILQTLRQ